MNEPKRIQRKRTKGWRMPEDAIYVGRPTKWGNPWCVIPIASARFAGHVGESVSHADGGRHAGRFERGRGAYWAVQMFKTHVAETPGLHDAIRAELAGRDLACWCPLEGAEGNRVPCHADVLLEIANGGAA